MTGYVYRGTRRDTMIDLEAANAPPEHGTRAGVNRHRKLRQPLCRRCCAVETARKNRSRKRHQVERAAEDVRVAAEAMFGDDEAQRAARRAVLAEAMGAHL